MRATGFDVFVNDVAVRHVDSTELNDKPRSGLVLAAGGDATSAVSARSAPCRYDIVGPDAPVHDSFDRAGTTSLGSTPTGQRWQTPSGTWTILRSEAVLESQPSLKPSLAVVDVGRADGWVQVTGTDPAARCRDSSSGTRTPTTTSRISSVPQFGTFNVIRVVNGRETRVGSTGLTTFGNGSTIGVQLQGDAHDDLRRRVPDRHASARPSCTTAHRAGLMIDSPQGRRCPLRRVRRRSAHPGGHAVTVTDRRPRRRSRRRSRPWRRCPHDRFPCFDGLRAIAALAVVVYHVTTTYNLETLHYDTWQWTQRLGNFGVSTFFLISGFLLYRPYVVALFTDRTAPKLDPVLGPAVPAHLSRRTGWRSPSRRTASRSSRSRTSRSSSPPTCCCRTTGPGSRSPASGWSGRW